MERRGRAAVTRRGFLRASSILSAAGVVGCGEGMPLDILPPPAFGPALSPLRGTREEIDDEVLTVVGGRLPTDLEGHALFASSVPRGDGAHLSTGEAMVTRLSFTQREVRAKTRLLRTDDSLLDEAAAMLGPSLSFRTRGLLRASEQLGARSPLHASLVPIFGGRILATSLIGRPWEIDAVTLDPVTPVGLRAAYLPPPLSSPGFALSSPTLTAAEPAWDAQDQLLYSADCAATMAWFGAPARTRVLRWDGVHEPTYTDLVDAATGEAVAITQSCSQVCTSERFVALADGAYLAEAEQLAGDDVTRAQRGTTVLWIVAKSALTAGGTADAVRCEIPIESTRFRVARDDTNDHLSVRVLHAGSSDASEWVRATDVAFDSGISVDSRLVGAPVAAADLASLGRYVIDARTGAVLERGMLTDERMWGADQWASDPRDVSGAAPDVFFATAGFDPRALTARIVDAYRDQPNRIVPVAMLPGSSRASQIVHVDPVALSIQQSLALPLGWQARSPTFVPRRGGAVGEGYLVAPVLGPDWDEVWILRADDLPYGPVCRLRHARFDVGLCSGAIWMPELSASRASYRVDRGADYAEGLRAISPEAATLARRVLSL